MAKSTVKAHVSKKYLKNKALMYLNIRALCWAALDRMAILGRNQTVRQQTNETNFGNEDFWSSIYFRKRQLDSP